MKAKEMSVISVTINAGAANCQSIRNTWPAACNRIDACVGRDNTLPGGTMSKLWPKAETTSDVHCLAEK